MFKYIHILVLFFAAVNPVFALSLDEVLAKSPANEIFPGADQIVPDSDNPVIAKAFKETEQIGLVYINAHLVNSTGYSGKPIFVLIGLDMQGIIRNVNLEEHTEPIVLIGIPEAKIRAVIDSYIGMDIIALMKNKDRELPYDAVSGATVTVRVIDDSIVRSAIKIVREYGLGGIKPVVKQKDTRIAEINTDINELTSWTELLASNSVTRLNLTEGEVNDAFASLPGKPNRDRKKEGKSGAEFIDLYAALVTVPSIGRSLLGDNEYGNLLNSIEPGQHAILIAANGPYSFKGSGYVRGGIFDRFEIVQNDNAIRFRDTLHKRLRQVEAEGAPKFKDVDLFRIPPDIEFNPTLPWHVELLVNREIGPREKEFVTFDLEYQAPEKYLTIIKQASAKTETVETDDTLAAYDDAPPLWVALWKEKLWQVIVLSLALALLTWIFFFQDWLVQRPLLLSRLRLGFLIFTFFGLGLFANAQLSVVNIFTVFNAFATSFDWGYFLMEPLIFILWGGVAGALLFWGRGAYCGWLCPFGALQELVNKVAKAFKVPQFTVPWKIHERLWSLKYIIFLVLFGVSLHSLDLAERMAEVEPFKTVIILKFIRDWPFVLFALLTVGASLFIERFYCRYLCPLGAALAIPARLRTFDWLKRYRQCGNPCQQCANDCMVQAIHPEGQINPNECLYCQHCQQLYYDEHRCPVMLQRRLKRERRESKASAQSSEVAEKILSEIKQSRIEKADV